MHQCSFESSATSITQTHTPIMHVDVVGEEEVDPKRQVDHIAQNKTTVRDFDECLIAPSLANDDEQPCTDRCQYTSRRVRCFRAVVARHRALYSRLHTHNITLSALY
jgi:predicted nucleic acid-binding Zn ribbon protein